MLSSIPLNSQVVDWSVRFGGPGGETMHDVVELDNGDFLVGGGSGSFLAPNQSALAYVARVSNEGALQWEKYYGDYHRGWVQRIFPDDSGAIVVGYVSLEIEENEYENHCWVAAIDLGGTIRWSFLPGPNHFTTLDAVRNEDSSITIVGGTPSSYTLIDLGPHGNVNSEHTFAPAPGTYPRTITHASDGGYVVVGQINSPTSDQLDYFAMKVSEDYDSTWFHSYGTSLDERPFGIAMLANGGYIIGGNVYGVNFDDDRLPFFVVTNQDGVFQSSQRIDSIGANRIHTLTTLSSGHIAISGGLQGDFLFGLAEATGEIKDLSNIRIPGGTGEVLKIIETSTGAFALTGGSSGQGFIALVRRSVSSVGSWNKRECPERLNLW